MSAHFPLHHSLSIVLVLGLLLFFFSSSSTGSATTGKQFNGSSFRTFTPPLRFSVGHAPQVTFIEPPGSLLCDRWCVVTTINEPTEAVLQHARLGPAWCLVVVGDIKSPSDYQLPGCDNTCRYLDKAAQEQYLALFGTFGELIPWNHFGRKNVGYLYAIHHGAKQIWDFDDDNRLIDDQIRVPGDFDVLEMSWMLRTGAIINPYPKMNPGVLPIWPRGFPLQDIKDDTLSKFAVHPFRAFNPQSIAVLQSLADHDPDVDAIYRMTQPLPVHFETSSKAILMLSQTEYAPINAQACLFLEPALWMLLLPVTVHGRVSDIWRGFLGERVLQSTIYHVGFSPPFVIQNRNPHSYIMDFDAELPLYQKTSALVQFLQTWASTATDIPGLYESYLVGMFERGYIEEEDILLGQAWLQALESIGYRFPTVRANSRWKKILLIVRFNFGHFESSSRVLWLWGKAFPNIVFTASENSLSPEKLSNIPESMRQKIILTTDSPDGWFYYREIPDIIEKFPNYEGYLIMHDDMYLKLDLLEHLDFEKLWIAKAGNPVDAHNLPNQWHWPNKGLMDGCVSAIDDATLNTHRDRLVEQCGFTHPLQAGQSDMFYIPQHLVHQSLTWMRLFGGRNCALEAAMPTIFFCLFNQNQVVPLNLYTRWDGIRNTPESVEECVADKTIQICHPFKLSNDQIWEIVSGKHHHIVNHVGKSE